MQEDVPTPEIDWEEAPEIPLEDLEVDDEWAHLWRHVLPRSVLVLGVTEGQAYIAAAECPDEAVIEKVVEATGARELDLVRVSEDTLRALHERLRVRR